MLPSADEDLVRRDADLPELATLLDPEAFAAALEERVPGLEVDSARVAYLKYKPGTNCLTAYKIGVGGREVDVYARTFGLDVEAKIGKALERESVPSVPGPGRVVFEDRAIVANFFPNDDELRSLKKLASLEDRRNLLKRIAPDLPEIRDGELRTLRYKPERRYVARVEVDGEPRAIVKFYREEDYRRARRNAGVFSGGFATTGPFRLTEMIGNSKRRRAVAFEWREGRPLREALLDPEERTAALETSGAALAEFHAQDPGGLRRLDRGDEAKTLLSLVEPLVHNSPRLEGEIRNLAVDLAGRLMSEPEISHPIHGDFYEDQVLIGEATATILDLDEAACGDPAADLGLFMAHLEHDAMRGHLPSEVVAQAAEALLGGYGGASEAPSAQKVSLYTAVGLFRLSPHPFRDRLQDWPELTEETLRRAEAFLKAEVKV
ncbi:MAG: phosphotransferase family protein [Rubrobacteraceae bacterium]